MNWAFAEDAPSVTLRFGGASITQRVEFPRPVALDDRRWRAAACIVKTREGEQGETRGPPFELPLFRYALEGAPGSGAREVFNDGPPVLLLHGATAWSECFAVPRRHNLVQQLLARGLDVWLLDWRGGRWMASWYVDPCYRDRIDFDAAAEHDLWGALLAISRARPGAALRIGGHCMGSHIAALGLARGRPAWVPEDAKIAVEALQLSSIGLFFVQPWDGLLRASDQLLERVAVLHPDCPGIHCDGDSARWPQGLDCWPEELDAAFQLWPPRLLPGRPAPRGQVRAQRENDGVPDAFTRLTFMFGRVVQWSVLDDELRTQAAFLRQFGMMPLRLFIHAGQNLRRGFADRYGAPERRDLYASEGGAAGLYPDAFAGLRRVTLITGRENDLWQRDTIDRMAEWLRPALGPERCVKHVVPGFGHQDLLWGAGQAGDEVRSLYVRALTLE